VNEETITEYSKFRKEILGWLAKTERNYYRYFLPPYYSKMGEDELSLFLDYDLIANDWIKSKTVSSLMPLSTGLLLQNEAETMVKWLRHSYHCGPGKYCHEPALPSTGLQAEYFSPLTYWRGPVWINMNWLFWLGLLDYGYTKEAEVIREGIFELVQRHGVREYYDPFTGKGLGGKDFSWTAALVIDMIQNPRNRV
jgi:neutral trehalase